MKSWNYLRYLLRHKFYVGIECFKKGLIWQGITHDLSKFLPDEFIPYKNFFGESVARRDDTGYYKPEDTGDSEFDMAWFRHQKRNSHHWQYYCQPRETEGIKLLKVPDRYVKEMVCDWIGAGKAQGTRGVLHWYRVNRNKLQLHPETRDQIEKMIGYKKLSVKEDCRINHVQACHFCGDTECGDNTNETL